MAHTFESSATFRTGSKMIRNKLAAFMMSLTVLVLLSSQTSTLEAQDKHNTLLPLVTAAAVPVYPVGARMAHIQGVVKLRATTDGHKFVSITVEDGLPMLAEAAKQNLLTWQFKNHVPTTILVTFEYHISEKSECDMENGTVTLDLPSHLAIAVPDLKFCDPTKLAP